MHYVVKSAVVSLASLSFAVFHSIASAADEPAAQAQTAPTDAKPAENAPTPVKLRVEKTPAEVASLAARIDAHLETAWKANHIEPAPAADDAEFLRRTWLNLAGRIPPVAESRKFLADQSADKRQQQVKSLLDSPAFVGHMTNVYRQMMIPEADTDFQFFGLIPPFEAWLREKLLDDIGYDRIVRELVTLQIANNSNTGPVAFYRAKMLKPENLAAGTSRLFLGVRLECAQCHDHPFAKWKREQFWSLAAFYSGIEGEQFGQMRDTNTKHELKIPDTEKTVQAKFLNGESPDWKSDTMSRKVLAEWLTSPENPYFARAAVNRLWAQMMGIGIVSPVDDFDENNPPSHPELLDELAREFAKSSFDTRFIIRAIASSRAYQLTSRQTHVSQDDPRTFARMSVKGLSGEELFDSLAQATGFYENVDFNNRFFGGGDGNARSAIKQLFSGNESTPTESQTSILQALALMNGQFVATQTHPADSSTLAAVIDSPFLDTAGKVETLYLAALTRKPSDEELKKMVEYVDAAKTRKSDAAPDQNPFRRIAGEIAALLPGNGGPPPDAKAVALGDVFWALLNSSEFILNH